MENTTFSTPKTYLTEFQKSAIADDILNGKTTIAQIVRQTGYARSAVTKWLPPRPPGRPTKKHLMYEHPRLISENNRQWAKRIGLSYCVLMGYLAKDKKSLDES
jgi:hypothetical protein